MFCGSNDLKIVAETANAASWIEKLKAWFRHKYGRTVPQSWLCLNCGKQCEEPAAMNDYIEIKEE